MGKKSVAMNTKWRQHFVDAVEKAYGGLRSVHENHFRNVKRGRAKCGSGLIEDVFAEMVYANVICADDNYIVLIDWPVTAKGKRQPQYHDFLLCRKQKDGCLLIVYAADLKTNSGFFRAEIKTAYKTIEDKLSELKKAAGLSSRQILGKKGKSHFKCSPNALYDLIIYSSVNNEKGRFDSQVDACNGRNDASKIIVLCDAVNNRIQTVRNSDFAALEQRLRRQMNQVNKEVKMVYPNVSDEVSVPKGTPNGTLFVSVDGTWKKKGCPATLVDCARGYWTDANLAAAHAEDCEWLMARQGGKIVGVWKINRNKGKNGWMLPSATPKKTWPNDKPVDYPRSGCELIPVEESIKKRFIGEPIHLGRCRNSLRGYFISNIGTQQ